MAGFMQNIRIVPEFLRTLDFNDIQGGYVTPIGTDEGIPANRYPVCLLYLQNLTDVTLLFSIDGINDHYILPTTGYLVLDISANGAIQQGAFFPQAQRYYARALGALPGSGAVYLTVHYNVGG